MELSPNCRTALSHNLGEHTNHRVSASESSDDERPRLAVKSGGVNDLGHESVMSPESSQALK